MCGLLHHASADSFTTKPYIPRLTGSQDPSAPRNDLPKAGRFSLYTAGRGEHYFGTLPGLGLGMTHHRSLV